MIILPEKLTLEQTTVKQFDGGYIGSEQVDASEKTLNPGQREGVRLHLTRQASFGLVDTKNEPLPLSSPFHSEAIGAKKNGADGGSRNARASIGRSSDRPYAVKSRIR